jgi:predicted small secreted protein
MEEKMKYFAFLAALLVMFSGCSNTWHGVKKDAGNAADWTKDRVNDGATWVKEKTDD